MYSLQLEMHGTINTTDSIYASHGSVCIRNGIINGLLNLNFFFFLINKTWFIIFLFWYIFFHWQIILPWIRKKYLKIIYIIIILLVFFIIYYYYLSFQGKIIFQWIKMWFKKSRFCALETQGESNRNKISTKKNLKIQKSSQVNYIDLKQQMSKLLKILPSSQHTWLVCICLVPCWDRAGL